ncbi:cytochrome C [Pseudomonas sp. HMWF032]|uniref:c-type cytochrome n=1 Tax=unclassified Pseudomonas TaxID=196821 RepID=UPI000D389C13|nr:MULTISPECIES: cytochrome c [unclassified Pseudomonas]PTS85104.1 cytochrome C [Pseudomonas sp. HMWF032]PTT86252.1 cytochrome C [Pseudomonas sp. HMWF010]WAC46564.1 cytochrome c [Pseudomonas sp. SL4(2022)]
MKRKTLSLVVLALALSGCGGVDPNSPQGQRQSIFKQMLKVSEDLGGMLRGRLAFKEQAFVEGAAKLDQLTRTPWQHFPQVRDDDEESRAKDDVWQRQARFQELARTMETSTAALVAATAAKPLKPDALVAPMQRVEDSCKACHEEFRAF